MAVDIGGGGGVSLDQAQTFTAAQTISVTDNTNPALKVTQLGTAPALLVEDSASPDASPFTVLADGTMLSGYTAAVTFDGSSVPARQILGGTTDSTTQGMVSWSSGATWAKLNFAKSRGAAPTHTVITSTSVLGEIGWCASDGTAFIPAASIRAVVDGTPGTNDMPAKIVFATTADGAATVTDRWQIGQQGMLRALAGSFSRGAPVTKTADFTVADTENWLINNKSGSTCTVTLPAASSYPGREIMFKNIQAQTLVSASSNVVPLGTTTAGTAILSANAGRWATLVSDASNWVIMAGVV